MKILFVIAEAYPFIKVGGLADVGGALPKALSRLGHDVRLLLPGYPALEPGRPYLSLDVPMGSRREGVEIRHHGSHAGVGVFSAANEEFFGSGTVYGGYAHGEVLPFIFFSEAAVKFAAGDPGWRPDVIHCNDWHTGLVPEYARRGPEAGVLEGTGTVFSIHNLAYQGYLGPEAETVVGTGRGEGSLLARGVAAADVVNTVSRGYLEEIVTPAHGLGMDRLLRSRRGDLYGILNGVDYEEFDPRADAYVAARYNGSFAEGKRTNKAALQRRSGLPERPGAPLVGMVARLVDQKGIDLLCDALDALDETGAQVVVMGRGQRLYELALEGAARTMENVAYHPTSEEAMARPIYAGSDLFLTPSLYEPCGLGPLIALRYGSIPVVRRTGGLAETIPDYGEDPEGGLGFTFDHPSARDLVRAVERSLAVYRREPEWRALQKRAMSADFSWERSSHRYEELYREAVVKRRAPERSGGPRDGSARSTGARRRAPLALVHHANQYIITDGYDNREGISELVDGYAKVLRLHEKYGLPANVHLSGTLIEAAAWHCPWFLELVRRMRAKGLVEIVGGTYSENIMPLFDAPTNREQLEEVLRLYEDHLGCPPGEIRAFWAPERVWDTHKLSPVLADPSLTNGGYRSVLLDERLLHPTHGAYPGSPRARFDAEKTGAATGPGADLARDCKPWKIEGGEGLTMVPVSSDLRYRVPPRFPDHWRRLEEAVPLFAVESGALMVYADDMEKTAGVGPWDAVNLERYEDFLSWVASREDVEPVLLSEYLRDHPAGEERRLEPGSYRELSRDWGAGEDYRGWSEDPTWRPYGAHLDDARRGVRAAERDGADARLLDLARKHLLASSYETAWHDPPGGDGEGAVPAHWARATAAHARSCRVITGAARWFAKPADERTPSAEVVDADGDGEEEVVLKDENLYAVVSPGNGGRLVYLFSLAPDGDGAVLVVGNPTDDWNWQEEQNRYMDRPTNHPGAFADRFFEHDRYEVSALGEDGGPYVELTNAQADSRLCGARKTLALVPGEPALAVRYDLPGEPGAFSTVACLSPDYLRLLREGRRAIVPDNGADGLSRGYRGGDATVWLALDGEEGTVWADAEGGPGEAGHGLNVRVEARAATFHLVLGCSPADDEGRRRLFERGREALEDRGAGTREITTVEVTR